MEIRNMVIEMLVQVGDIEGDLFSSLTPEEQSALGTYEDWSIKDQVAHCAAWMDRLARNISVTLEGIKPTRSEDIDRENEEIFYEYNRRSWEEVLAYSRQAKDALVEIVQNISDEDLFVSELLPWQGGRELWKVILGTGYTHPLTHYSQVHMKLGHLKQALNIQEQMSQKLMELDENPSWRGVALYNLACFYALSGEKNKAITGLKEALRLNPALTDWSKQDPDFNSIRDDPDFLTIYVT